jgi:hypothetical protein
MHHDRNAAHRPRLLSSPHAFVEFVESPSLPVKPAPEPAPAKVRSAPHRRFARIGFWTILPAVVSVVLYAFFKAWHKYRIRTQMDEIARQSARTEALSLRAEIATELKIFPELFSDYILAERRAGRLDAASDLAWGEVDQRTARPVAAWLGRRCESAVVRNFRAWRAWITSRCAVARYLIDPARLGSMSKTPRWKKSGGASSNTFGGGSDGCGAGCRKSACVFLE